MNKNPTKSDSSVVITIPACPRDSKKKVAAYCRVSTNLPSQESSIESQRLHYESLIRANPEWELAGIYLEAGVSGTKAENRPELQRLIKDCKAGNVDLVLTKSISRFSRNTTDCLTLVRLLTGMNVQIRFEKENIDTETMGSEFLLSILSCFAEEESRSISENLKWGIRKRFENGTYRQSIAPYGYIRTENGFTSDPKKASVVKNIFKMALSGTGTPGIANRLNDLAIPSPTGKMWSPKTIRQILSNPFYVGATFYQQTFTDRSYLQKKNDGTLDRFYNTSHHDPIISKADFLAVQAVIRQRAEEVGYAGKEEGYHGGTEESTRGQTEKSTRTCFSGKLICASCGSTMHRQKRNSGAAVWICTTHKEDPGKCSMKPQHETDLMAAFTNCVNKLAWLLENAAAEKYMDRKWINYLQEWVITDDPRHFPETFFEENIASCGIDTGRTAAFYFQNGVCLSESLEQGEDRT